MGPFIPPSPPHRLISRRGELEKLLGASPVKRNEDLKEAHEELPSVHNHQEVGSLLGSQATCQGADPLRVPSSVVALPSPSRSARPRLHTGGQIAPGVVDVPSLHRIREKKRTLSMAPSAIVEGKCAAPPPTAEMLQVSALLSQPGLEGGQGVPGLVSLKGVTVPKSPKAVSAIRSQKAEFCKGKRQGKEEEEGESLYSEPISEERDVGEKGKGKKGPTWGVNGDRGPLVSAEAGKSGVFGESEWGCVVESDLERGIETGEAGGEGERGGMELEEEEICVETEEGLFKELSGLLEELVGYTIFHFHSEEEMYIRLGLPKERFRRHVQIHQELIAQVGDLLASIDLTDTAAVDRLVRFLKVWIGVHIQQQDKQDTALCHKLKRAWRYLP
uniref:Hemerythrin-like domain-containing protein n=1 Tax=Chromera velia CCMP2878 TaxID=1169474 RepID=A0A0G4IFN6_9ALVE|eukprot:Cvel_13949.t1-p1 / transcript=Cvel_13949.t1 / gene=Cvel_13949 / organism=Chromera_velia_CCMP2878 / gene_product=hypothetical protein / transcript_product=hypothetical protein / location=Cvel_scaffold974:15558-17941(+) / protein_length=387 / sequence_SO=supercontig / SO=protein_coding / is_pseudo=false